MVHVGLHSVGTYHKKFGGQNVKKQKYGLPSVYRRHSVKSSLPSAQHLVLGKETSLPSARLRLSTKADGRQL
jgi:hypothetical protein